MEEYLHKKQSKPNLDDTRACHCIGPENCENSNCSLVIAYRKGLKNE